MNKEPKSVRRNISSSQLFIELEELRGRQWEGTGRWNHALEEEVASPTMAGPVDQELWQRPHLPTISVMALVRLRRSLTEKNVFVDVPGTNFDMVISAICNRLTENGLLFATAHGRVVAALTTLQEKKSMDATLEKLGGSRERLPTMAPLSSSRERLEQFAPPAEKASSRDRSPSYPTPRFFDTPDEEGGELYHMLDPDSGEEAVEMMIANLDFLDATVMAFCRLKAPIAAKHHPAPVRYVFLVLTTAEESKFAVKMAHAFAAVLVDSRFVTHISEASNAQGLLRVLDAQLNTISILPHVSALQADPGLGGDSATGAGDDEDDVLMESVEEQLRRHKGMTPKPKTHSPALNRRGLGAGSGKQSHSSRPNFAELLPENEVVLGEGMSPVCDRSPYMNGQSLQDTPSSQPAALRKGLFIEMEQQRHGMWAETHHWNWALGQEASASGGWSKPKLPTISVIDLLAFYQGMGAHNVHIGLKEPSLLAVTEIVMEKLVKEGLLPQNQRQLAVDAIKSRSDIKSVASEKADDPTVPQSLLYPESGIEAFELLIAHVPFLTNSSGDGRPDILMAFVRLDEPIDLGCEGRCPARFLLIMLVPDETAASIPKRMRSRSEEAVQMATAFAALMLDEDFSGAMLQVTSVAEFLSCFWRALENVTVVPHAHLGPHLEAALPSTIKAAPSVASSTGGNNDNSISSGKMRVDDKKPGRVKRTPSMLWAKVRNGVAVSSKLGSRRQRQRMRWLRVHPVIMGRGKKTGGQHMTLRLRLRLALAVAQRYSLPLLLGIVVALLWANLAQDNYEYIFGVDHSKSHVMPFGEGAILFDHPITLHFLVNDIFMVFFFGLAAKEVTEACLPGGSLNPPRKAMSPLIATLGGVAGPVCTYLIIVILQWEMGAFDEGATNSTGRMLAAASGDEPTTLSLLIRGWGVPTATDISLAWMVAMQVFPFGHPAVDYLLLLAVADDAMGLVIIATAYSDPDHPIQPQYLPLLLLSMVICAILRHKRVFGGNSPWWVYLLLGGVPAWFGLVAAQLHPALALCFVVPFMPARHHSQGGASTQTGAAPLDAFEHAIKLPVDLGLFFFTLANAGVNLGNVGPLTSAILLALLVGKLVGISGFALIAHKCKLAPMPAKMSVADLLMVALIASIGLTVALFIAGEAFEGEVLQAEAKMGALLSGSIGCIAYGISRLDIWRNRARPGVARPEANQVEEDDDDDDVYHTIAAQLERSLLLRQRSRTDPATRLLQATSSAQGVEADI